MQVTKGTFYSNFQDSRIVSNSAANNKLCAVYAGNNSQYNLTSYSKPSFGKWFHAACTETREFICYHEGSKFHLLPILSSSKYNFFPSAPMPLEPPYENDDDPECGAGWMRNGENCYRVHTNSAPWRLAKQTCQNTDATSDLLWITTKQEALFINSTNFGQYGAGLWIDFYAETGASNWYWPYRQYTNKWHVPMAVTRWAPGRNMILN